MHYHPAESGQEPKECKHEELKRFMRDCSVQITLWQIELQPWSLGIDSNLNAPSPTNGPQVEDSHHIPGSEWMNSMVRSSCATFRLLDVSAPSNLAERRAGSVDDVVARTATEEEEAAAEAHASKLTCPALTMVRSVAILR